jgi:hypothetical protein
VHAERFGAHPQPAYVNPSFPTVRVLISHRQDRLALVTHPDHGRLAGALGEHWGNERFAPVMARDALLDAAAHHDHGWSELDDQPVFNADAGRPAHFLEVPLSDTVGPYARGVDRVYARSALAGALVSMHWSGLYRTRWGLSDGEPVRHPAAAEVVAEQERRWIAALREAWGGRGRRSAFEAQAWHAYEVLQALDCFSLAICLLDLEHPSGDEQAVPIGATLPHVEQPPGGRLVSRVPAADGGDAVDVRIWVSAPGEVALEPYPLSRSGVELELPVRSLEARRYGSDGEAAAAFHAAAVQTLAVRIAAG